MSTQEDQPERAPGDGPVSVSRTANACMLLTTTQDGITASLVVSPHNAWRLFGLMALTLGVTLPARVARGIKL